MVKTPKSDFLFVCGVNSLPNKYRVYWAPIYLPFEEARSFVRNLNLKSMTEWRDYSKNGGKPENIPTNPHRAYKSVWVSWGDWLGTGRIADQLKEFLPFEDARIFAWSLKLGSQKEWFTYCKSGKKPKNIPACPSKSFRNEWVSWKNWLGYEKPKTRFKVFLSFEEARVFVRNLNLANQKEWFVYCKSGKKPKNIPANPLKNYKDKFKGYKDWLGTGYQNVYLCFKEAQAFVGGLALKSQKEWKAYCKSGKKPKNIPAYPELVYKNEWKGYKNWLGKIYLTYEEAHRFVLNLNLRTYEEWKSYCKGIDKPYPIPSKPERVYVKEWVSWGDWLGTGNRQFIFFEEARSFVRNLNLKSKTEWDKYCKNGGKPKSIPTNPHTTYKSVWVSWGDWLGTGRIADQLKEFLPFEEARVFARSLKLSKQKEWFTYCKSGKKPVDIPCYPNRCYNINWVSWRDWLGTAYISNFEKQFLPFKKARVFARSLKLKGQKEWRAYSKSVHRHSSIPAAPNKVYKTEWISWGDWLGTGTIATNDRVYKPFKESRKLVRKLKIRSQVEWFKYSKTNKKPSDIPANPHSVYKREWISWGDWLGTSFIATQKRMYLTYEEARTFVHTIGIKSQAAWRDYINKGNKPDNIPAKPALVYNGEWVSWGDWLGTGILSPVNKKKQFLPFCEARKYAKGLNLKTSTEWREYSKNGNKPENIPANPDQVYKEHWKGFRDWLGNGV